MKTHLTLPEPLKPLYCQRFVVISLYQNVMLQTHHRGKQSRLYTYLRSALVTHIICDFGTHYNIHSHSHTYTHLDFPDINGHTKPGFRISNLI